MLISIIVHVFIIGGATVWVVSSIQPQRKALFNGGENAAPEIRHPVKMSNTQPNLDTLTKRISVDTPDSVVALPDLPDSQDAGISSPSLAPAIGSPGGAGGGLAGPLMPIFGFKEPQKNGTLVGTLYDFKQLRGRKPNPELAALNDNAEQLAYQTTFKFVNSGWAKSILYKYYKSPQKLYASQIIIPQINASEGPKAFGVEGEIKPRGFIVLYEGRVSPPETGTYRFVGAADDIMMVALDGRLVLDGCLYWSTRLRSQFHSDNPQPASYKNKINLPRGLLVGNQMALKKGTFYDIKILIGEGPGGKSQACLFYQKDGINYEKDELGSPFLPVFRISNVETGTSNGASIMKDGPIWSALPVQASSDD
ncbi:MAG TPA: PA14 domain-containing protein [Rariglobus sp.]|nr:PA14 domain-containing protein [Rariglobus sp.]